MASRGRGGGVADDSKGGVCRSGEHGDDDVFVLENTGGVEGEGEGVREHESLVESAGITVEDLHSLSGVGEAESDDKVVGRNEEVGDLVDINRSCWRRDIHGERGPDLVRTQIGSNAESAD